MKDYSNRLTQEQKESIYEFFAHWVISVRPVKFRENDTGGCYFNEGDSYYESYMDIFNKTKLSSIIVNTGDIMLHVNVKDIENDKNIDIITNFILSNKNKKGLLTDDEFFNLTKIYVNKLKLRFKKIKKIKDGI